LLRPKRLQDQSPLGLALPAKAQKGLAAVAESEDNMTTPTMVEAWFRLMNDALRGNSEAQEALKLLTGGSPTPNALLHWTSRFMPASGISGPFHPELFEEWLEQYWKIMGVVPRYRYLELLERNEGLRIRLEKAEKVIQQQRSLTVMNQPEEAQKVLTLWGNVMEETLRRQGELMQAWLPKDSSEAPGTTEVAQTEVSGK